ncbi:peptidoglycan endopeptidase [Coprococcus sp. AF21-14LB]|nr:C40 family peptidase [Coprococcus sp. AF21-14LB]RGS75124.1 peptidoglycan endopeptidase [Coprococcus sp. AF21-14LB]
MHSHGKRKQQPLQKLRQQKQPPGKQRIQSQLPAGQAVVDFACQFIGNPYVWGGTSLTNGADCSGFVQAVYANFGISMPRTSSQMRSAGVEVSFEQAIPGDVFCYEGHVGIYIGDGQIVNAIDETHGIGISSATYTNIITIRRLV